jgi:hypothetical protein
MTKQITQAHRKAESILKAALKERGIFIYDCFNWQRWTYNNRPFWSVWATLYHEKKSVYSGQVFGLHIHDDGEVLIVCQLPEIEIGN